MNDLVSVIIPTYNRSQFVTQAIESVLCQTYPNIELIVVNDGSTDDTEEKLQPYMDRLTYISKKNGGISSAVNAGLRVAKGSYIARLDDDDLFMPEKTEKQLEVFEENPDVGLVTSGCFVIDSVGRTISVRRAPDFSPYGHLLTLLLKDWVLIQPTVMVRRECHDKVGFYKDVFAEDLEMFLCISRYWNIGVFDQPLAKYRRHSGNITSLLSENEEFRQDIEDFMRDIIDDIPVTEFFPAISSTSDAYSRSCAYAAKGALYIHHGAFDRAEANLIKALEICPTNSIPVLWLGILARTKEDFPSAEEYFNRIQESDELYTKAQSAKALTTTIQRNEGENSRLLNRELVKERMRLFDATFNGVSGKVFEKKRSPTSSAGGLATSRYVVIVDDYPQNGKHLVFNSFTHAMLNVDDDLRNLICEPNRPVDRDVLKDLSVLRKIGIVVDDRSDETEIVKKWYNDFRADMSRISATILTNYDCNFACTYCIEEGVRKPVYMDEPYSDSAADWLIKEAEENDTKEILLLFYGGEPLLNTEPIYRISEKLQKFALEKGLLVSSSITTNGSLLNSQLLEDLTRYGLRSVKLTIDGTKEIHDARRPFRSGKGSFDLIVDNIQKIPEAISLTVQTNLDSENISGFPDLLDFFESSALKDRIDKLVISSVYRSPASMPAAQKSGCVNLSDLQVTNELTYLKRLAAERGYESQSDGINYTICGMHRSGAMPVIDPLGNVYDCPAFVGREEFCVGNIREAELSRKREFPVTQLEQCFGCTYFPICGGGCPYKAYLLYGDHTRILCEREVMERQTKEALKLRYDQRMKQKVLHDPHHGSAESP